MCGGWLGNRALCVRRGLGRPRACDISGELTQVEVCPSPPKLWGSQGRVIRRLCDGPSAISQAHMFLVLSRLLWASLSSLHPHGLGLAPLWVVENQVWGGNGDTLTCGLPALLPRLTWDRPLGSGAFCKKSFCKFVCLGDECSLHVCLWVSQPGNGGVCLGLPVPVP